MESEKQKMIDPDFEIAVDEIYRSEPNTDKRRVAIDAAFMILDREPIPKDIATQIYTYFEKHHCTAAAAIVVAPAFVSCLEDAVSKRDFKILEERYLQKS